MTSEGRSDGQRFRDALERAVGAAIVDLRLPLRLLAVALLADGHALIEDVPGTGKTTLARAFARALGLSFAASVADPERVEDRCLSLGGALGRLAGAATHPGSVCRVRRTGGSGGGRHDRDKAAGEPALL